MAFSFTKSRPSPIALDFGADSLKAMQVLPGQKPQLIAAASVSIPGEVRQDTHKRKAFLASALQRMIKDQPFKGRRAICSAPAFQTLIQHVAIPRSEGSDIDNLVGLHLMERLGVDPKQMVIRTHDLGQRTRNGQTIQELACLAVPRETVMGYVRLAERARLEVVGMHSEPPAIIRGFEAIFNRRTEDHTSVTCYIDVGAASTKVVVADGFKLVFAKRIDAGGDQVTEALAEARSLSFDDARARRMAMESEHRVAEHTDDAGSASGSARQSPEPEQPAGPAVKLGVADDPPGQAQPPTQQAPTQQSPTGQERRMRKLGRRRPGIAALDAMVVDEPRGDVDDPGVAHAVTEDGRSTDSDVVGPADSPSRGASASFEASSESCQARSISASALTGDSPAANGHWDVGPTSAATSVTAEPATNGLPTPDAAPTLADSPKLESEMLDCLVDELQLCLRHYQTLRPDRAIDQVVFLGGESNHIEACREVARSIGLPAQLGDPFARLRPLTDPRIISGIDPARPQPGWAVPLGLCFSEANL